MRIFQTCILYMAKGPYLIALLLEMDLENNDWQVAQSARLTIGNQLPVTSKCYFCKLLYQLIFKLCFLHNFDRSRSPV